MELSCSKENLLSGVQAVERIVSTKTTLPIIGNVLFETVKEGIKLSANNLEMGLEVFINADIKKEGSILVPARTLGGIVSKLPSTDIHLNTTEKGIVKISYKQSNFNINGLSPDEFPVLPKIKESKPVKIAPKTFIDMAKQTVFAVSTSEDKYILNGVLLEMGKSQVDKDESNIRMVATDGFRLARRGEKIPGVVQNASVIVPAKALAEVIRMIQGQDEDLVMNISTEQISFKYKDSYLVSRLIQGQFPDYKQVIPKSTEITMIAGTAALEEACERAAVIASGSLNIVKLKIQDGKLHIIASTPDVGNIDEVLDVEIKGSSESMIAFNVRLILDVLKNIGSEKTAIEFTGPLNPGLIKPFGGDDYLYIIMPMKTMDTPV